MSLSLALPTLWSSPPPREPKARFLRGTARVSPVARGWRRGLFEPHPHRNLPRRQATGTRKRVRKKSYAASSRLGGALKLQRDRRKKSCEIACIAAHALMVPHAAAIFGDRQQGDFDVGYRSQAGRADRFHFAKPP